MDSIYPIISSGRLLNENDYDKDLNMLVKCYFIEVDIYIPE